MRKELLKYKDKRFRFIATVEKFSSEANFPGLTKKTIFLKDIKFQKTGESVVDQISYNVKKTIEKLNLSVGDIIQFDASVKTYVKGLVGPHEVIDVSRLDIKLTNTTKFLKIPNEN